MPAAQRMFGAKFDPRPDAQIADDFCRDDVLAIPIAWDAEHGAGGGVYANGELASLRAAHPDVFLPDWAMVDPWRGRKGLEEIEQAIKTLGRSAQNTSHQCRVSRRQTHSSTRSGT